MDGYMMVHSTVGESQDDGDELYKQDTYLSKRLRDSCIITVSVRFTQAAI